MKVKHYIALAALTLPLAANAQSINFETENEGYTKLGVFDTWEKSPFRTGALEGNVKVIANPYRKRTPWPATPICLTTCWPSNAHAGAATHSVCASH